MKIKNVAAVAMMTAALMMAHAAPLYAGAVDGELRALLKSPVGKFLMMETEEGAAILAHLNKAAKAGNAAEAEVIAQMLTKRLSLARDRFQALAAMAEGMDAKTLLKQIAAESLSTRAGGQGSIEFVPENRLGFEVEKKAFLAEKRPGKMAGADLKGEVLDFQTKLGRSDLRFADMTEIDAPFSQFDGALMERASLEGGKLKGASFEGASLKGANFKGAKLVEANFQGADLRGADLRGANLTDANLIGADLRGANLTGAHARGLGFELAPTLKLEGAIIDARTVLPQGMTIERAKALGAKVVTE